MSDPLQSWVSQVSERPLPVWRASRDALVGLGRQGRYNGSALTRALAHDPLLCVQLLRRANSGKSGGSIATLEQAAVMMGAQALTAFAEALPVLEDKLPAEALLPLRQLQRRDFHVAYLARELVRRYRETHYDDAFFAGLLHNLGEMALRVHSPSVIPQIRRRALKQGLPLAAAAQEVLGFDVSALSGALARQWRLPPVVRAVLDNDHAKDRTAELVGLCVGILHTGPDALWDDDPRVRRVAEILGEGVPAVRRHIFCAAAAAAAWLVERIPPSVPGVVELFPEEPADSHEDEPPAPAPEPQPEALARFDALVRSPRQPLTLQQVLEQFTVAVREGLGLDRVVFAVLTADRASLRGRFFRGVAADSPLQHFQFERLDANVFSRLLERPGGVWAKLDSAPPALQALLTPQVRKVVEAREFVAQSVFLAERPVGLCYADRGSSNRPITAQDYNEFRRQCLELARHLARLNARPA